MGEVKNFHEQRTKRVKVGLNSSDCLSRDKITHTSVAYNRTGKHLERSNSKMVSSEAALPTLPYTALKAQKTGFRITEGEF